MEDVSNWYSSSIRIGVYDQDNELKSFCSAFIEWMAHRAGQVVIQKAQPSTDGGNNFAGYPKYRIYFEKQEDLADYLLTFEEQPRWSPDVAAFYAPYIPLTIFSSSTQPNWTTPSVSLVRIYDDPDNT